jgi:hypothetical protein
MKHLCECGRPAVYVTSTRRRRRARFDHNLCFRCFKKLAAKARQEDINAQAKSTPRPLRADEPAA